MYYRYVDDIILAAPKEEIHTILNFNSYHYRLKFTLETEVDHCLSFLDLTIIIKNTRIITDWFQKNTFLERFLSFFSNPTCHKPILLVTKWVLFTQSGIDRAIKLSHPSFHEKNLRLCIKLLLDNGYPLDLIFNKINLRLKKLFVHRSEATLGTTNIDISLNHKRKI